MRRERAAFQKPRRQLLAADGFRPNGRNDLIGDA